MDELGQEPTVAVRFPDGVRRVRAVPRRLDRFCVLGDRDRIELLTYEPREMQGWRFVEMVGGEWVATPA